MKHLLPLFFFSFILLFSATNSTPFSCTTKSTCQSLVDYTSPNATTILQLKTLFNLNSIRALLSTNNLPLNTAPSYRVPPNSTTRISFTCRCTANGTGVPSRPPKYKVGAGNTLDSIARTLFGGLVTYQQIATFNNITDPNLIDVGQVLKIPLPCGCDDVDGMKVVHYGHVVEMGASLDGIGNKFGVDKNVLLSLNGLKSDKLFAGQLLDVPLRACSSSISGTSRDHNLLVPNDSYVLTANNCVQCSCSSTSWQLDCRPAQMMLTKFSCPPAKCGNLFIGNTSSTSACNSSKCTYNGFANNTILTNLTVESVCNNGVPMPQPTGGSGGRYSHGSFLIFLEMMLVMLACVF